MNAFIRSQMKKVINDFLTDRCTIRKRVGGTDAYGAARTTTWQTVASVSCRVITDNQRRHEITVQGKQDTMPDVVRLVVRDETPLDVGYQVEIERTGETFEVIEVRSGLTDGVDKSAWLKRYRGED